jgi:hypothetical protein
MTLSVAPVRLELDRGAQCEVHLVGLEDEAVPYRTESVLGPPVVEARLALEDERHLSADDAQDPDQLVTN